MLAKQVTVFIENRKGRLGEVLDVLKKNEINILALSLADTSDYGLLRLIVNDPEKCREKLTIEGFSTLISDILVIEITHTAGSLQALPKLLSNNDLNVEYMYGQALNSGKALIVLKTSDFNVAISLCEQLSIKTLSLEEIAKV